MRKTPKAEIARRVDEVLRLLGLDELLHRRPAVSREHATTTDARQETLLGTP